MMRWIVWLWLVSLPVWAENDLLKVGKTPAEKLEEKTARVKDNVARALEKLEQRKKATTEGLFAIGGPEPAPALPDPTAPDDNFQQTFRTLLRGQTRKETDALPPMPQVELGALVLKEEMEPAALLKVDGHIILIRNSEEITLVRDGQTIHLRIQEISDDSVRLLVLPHNEPLILH